jgi:hypothetical protein
MCGDEQPSILVVNGVVSGFARQRGKPEASVMHSRIPGWINAGQKAKEAEPCMKSHVDALLTKLLPLQQQHFPLPIFGNSIHLSMQPLPWSFLPSPVTWNR